MIKTKLLHTSSLTLCGLRRAELDYTLAFDAECQLWRHVQQVFNEPWHVFLWQTQDQLQSWDRIWERNHISWEEGPLSSAYEKVHVSYLYLNLWRRGTKIRLVASSSTQPPVTWWATKVFWSSTFCVTISRMAFVLPLHSLFPWRHRARMRVITQH